MVTWQSCSIITACAPGDHKRPLVDPFSIPSHRPLPPPPPPHHHHIEPSPISIKRFDGSYNPLNHFLPLWSEPETAGWKGWTPRGSAVSSHRYYIMFIWKEEGEVHMCQCPAGWLWSWLPSAPTYLPGSRVSEASWGSDMSEGHNFSQIKAAEAPPPGAGDAMSCPLTCPTRVREKK